MKKYLCLLGVIVLVVVIFMLPLKGYTWEHWVLYDNFNEGFIDPDRWEAPPPTITVEEGELKIVHVTGEGPAVTNLLFFKNPDRMKAVRVTTRFGDCAAGYMWSSIGGDKFQDEEGHRLVSETRVINSFPNLLEHRVMAFDSNQIILYPEFISQLPNVPSDIIDVPFTIEMYIDKNEYIASFNDYGFISIYIPEHLLIRRDEYGIRIGTVSSPQPTSECVVYFDDVYVIYNNYDYYDKFEKHDKHHNYNNHERWDDNLRKSQAKK